MKTINLKELIEKRLEKIMLITQINTRKLVKREVNKLKKDIIKQIKGF